MIRATLADAETVNALVGGDFSEVLAEPMHVCLLEGENGAVFAWRGPGTYEAHVFYSVAGRDAIELARRMLAHMREEYGARTFWGMIPDESRKVKLFVRWLGWKPGGLFETRNGPCELFVSEN